MKLVNKRNASLVLSNLEVADTFYKKVKGLLGRKKIPFDYGLLFPNCNAIHMIGMKFPIDVIFTDRDKKILKIYHHYKPGSVMFWPVQGAYYTIELSAGLCKVKDIKEGDILEWDE